MAYPLRYSVDLARSDHYRCYFCSRSECFPFLHFRASLNTGDDPVLNRYSRTIKLEIDSSRFMNIFLTIYIQSPWWLVRKGRVEEAKRAIQGLTSKTDSAYSVDDTVAMMVHTNEHEKYVSEGVSYLDCFTGVDLRRTEIICCVWMIQVFCGIWYGGNVVYFLEVRICAVFLFIIHSCANNMSHHPIFYSSILLILSRNNTHSGFLNSKPDLIAQNLSILVLARMH